MRLVIHRAWRSLKRPTRMWLTDEEQKSSSQSEHTVECTCQQCTNAILLEDDPADGQWVHQAYATPDATADVMAWLGSDDETELDAAPPPSRPGSVARPPLATGRQRPSLSRPMSTSQRAGRGNSDNPSSHVPPKPLPPSVASNPLAARRSVSQSCSPSPEPLLGLTARCADTDSEADSGQEEGKYSI
jgi:hypothetical protein